MLELGNSPRVAFAGSGGKTTALFTLAREYSSPVLVTVTSHLELFQTKLADAHIYCDNSPVWQNHLPQDIFGVTLFSGPKNNRSVAGLKTDSLHPVLSLADKKQIPLLVEADGSRRHPVKAPAQHEPPIPDFVDTVIYSAGLSALGKPCTSEWVHRPEIYIQLCGLKIGETITINAMQRVLCHPNGGLKNIPPHSTRIALLNQADTLELQECAGELARKLLPIFDVAIVASLKNNMGGSTIHAVYT